MTAQCVALESDDSELRTIEQLLADRVFCTAFLTRGKLAKDVKVAFNACPRTGNHANIWDVLDEMGLRGQPKIARRIQ